MKGITMKEIEKEKQRKLLIDKAISRCLEENGFDAINYLNDKDSKQFLELEYKLGFSEYDPNEDEED